MKRNNIFTNTTVNGGQTGINSFNKFNVYEGDIVEIDSFKELQEIDSRYCIG